MLLLKLQEIVIFLIQEIIKYIIQIIIFKELIRKA